MRIALKEAKETVRWIQTLVAVGAVQEQRVDDLLRENAEIIAILTTIVRKTTQAE